ncbi:MAG: tetratricopeptide repeat protein [Sandaracinaceae bacterium]|nr:tetratricopeptide repeat protein [Sandaracinaceae bacterium]
MREVDEEIREIRKEIIESRGLVIKSNNLTNSLAADIKSIAKRQAGYERRFIWNSWIAYILFASLSFVGLWLATNYRVAEAERENERLEAALAEARAELTEANNQAERRARAETAAASFYRSVRERRRTEVVERWPELRREQLSRAEAAFFRDTVDHFHLDLSLEAYQNGLDLMRTGRYAEAAEAFQEAIRQKEEAAHIPGVKLQLARALRRLGRHAEARVLAQQVVDQTIDRELQDDALLLYAAASEDLEDIDEARNALRTFLRRWPRGAESVSVRRHLADLNRRVMRGEVGTRTE